MRWAGSGRGKRGFRTVYCHHANSAAVYLLAAYAKADRAGMKPADRKVLSRPIAEIEKEETK